MLNNRDLRIAAARIGEARASLRSARAARWPIDDLAVRSGTGRASVREASAAGIPRDWRDRSDADWQASWEADLWGRVRANIRAARADARAAEALAQDVALLVVADTARAYLRIRALQVQQAQARSGIALQRDVLQITEVRASVGEADSGEAAAARAELRATEATLPQLDAQIETSIAALALLTGGSTAELRASLATPAGLPRVANGQPALATPLDVIGRRPDVRAAEANLAAADAQLAAAAADLIPRLSIVAQGASAERTLGGAFDGTAISLGASLQLRLPLFNRAALYAGVDAADARRLGALAGYEQAVQKAIADTEAALARLEQLSRASIALDDAVAAGADAVRVANVRYGEGDQAFLNVLIAQRDQLRREQDRVEGQAALATEYVNLFQNLGIVPAMAASPKPTP